MGEEKEGGSKGYLSPGKLPKHKSSNDNHPAPRPHEILQVLNNKHFVIVS